MEKKVFYHTQQLLRRHRSDGEIKLDAECQQYIRYLVDEYQFGKLEHGYFKFTFDDRLALIRNVKAKAGLDLDHPYPETKSRDLTAEDKRSDKNNSHAVSRDFILVNSLTELRINNQRVAKNPFTSLGHYIHADEVLSVEHPYIVLVENLILMANLDKLVLPEILQDALWLYRGDIKPQQQTSKAYEFFRRFESHRLICFSDLDPAGIQIAITSGATKWLSPLDCRRAISLKQTEKLFGIEKEWFDQVKEKTFLGSEANLPTHCQLAFNLMQTQRMTLQQEHMLAHHLALGLFEL